MRTKRTIMTLSLAQLEALRSDGTTVFHCAHHWVTDASITEAICSYRRDDPRIPWDEHTDRAARIGTIAMMMCSGVVFPELALRVLSVADDVYHVELEDGHHRLRALQYLQRTNAIRFAIAGDVTALRRRLNFPKLSFHNRLMLKINELMVRP